MFIVQVYHNTKLGYKYESITYSINIRLPKHAFPVTLKQITYEIICCFPLCDPFRCGDGISTLRDKASLGDGLR